MKKKLAFAALAILLAITSCQSDEKSGENEVSEGTLTPVPSILHKGDLISQIGRIKELDFPYYEATYSDIFLILSEYGLSGPLSEKLGLEIEKLSQEEIVIRSNYGNISDVPIAQELVDSLHNAGLVDPDINPANCEASFAYTITPKEFGFSLSSGAFLRVGAEWKGGITLAYNQSFAYFNDIETFYKAQNSGAVEEQRPSLRIIQEYVGEVNNEWVQHTWRKESDGTLLDVDHYYGITTLSDESLQSIFEIMPEVVDACFGQQLGSDILNELTDLGEIYESGNLYNISTR